MDKVDMIDKLQMAAADLEADCFLLWLLEDETCSARLMGYGKAERDTARDLLYRTLTEHVNALCDLADRAAERYAAAGEAIT